MLAQNEKNLGEPSIMQRRTFLTTGLAATALPHRFAIAQSARARTLRFVPQANLTLLDPIFATALVTVTPNPTPTPSSSVARTKLLNYLNQISGNHTLSGVISRQNMQEFDQATKALGYKVAVSTVDPWIYQGGYDDYDDSYFKRLMAHSNAGGIIGIHTSLPNPATFGGTGDTSNINPNRILTNGTADNNRLRRILDRVAAGLRPYKNANKAVIYRALIEMAGNWFWWGAGNFSVSQYIQLFRFVHDYLVVTKGLDNLLFLWGANGEAVPSVTDRYPGDDYIDIIGWDSYTDNPGPDSLPIYNWARSNHPTKLLAYAEFGSGNPSSPNPNFNAQTLIDSIKNQEPRICFTITWSGWGYDTMRNASNALRDPFVINRAQVNIP
jgi:hypothetical protein